jgi:hypothetical protein
VTLFKGKKPAVARPTDFKLAEYLDVELVLAKPYKPHDKGYPMRMYGNGPDDSVRPGFGGCGCCFWATMANGIQLSRHASGKAPAPITGKEVVGAYSESEGYRIGDASTDQGTEMGHGLAFMRKTGMKDASRTRHKIGAYLSIAAGDSKQMVAATHALDSIAIGIVFPASAMQQFDEGKPWTYVPGSPDEGGHAILGSRPLTDGFDIDSWGREVHATKTFLERKCDEVFAVIYPEVLDGTGHSPEGLDTAALNKALAALRA